jgi:diguanylate cyclase (GGDEF)-like protein
MRRALASPRWLYALVAVPMVTDIIETGALPGTVRGWCTEVVAGAVIAALVRQVLRDRKALIALAHTDGLTGLWNRRAFIEALEDECARAKRLASPLAVVYIDIDRFKDVNDNESHARGDQLLVQLARAIAHVVRSRVDRAFRLGGDEFALILPGTCAEHSAPVIERIRHLCADAAMYRRKASAKQAFFKAMGYPRP